MAKSIIQQIKFCANKLKNSKLARLGGKEMIASEWMYHPYHFEMYQS